MPRLSHITVAKIASSIAVATLLSFSPAKAQYNGGYSAPQQQGQNPALAQVKDTLQRYGSIVQHARYGEVWIPAQGSTVPAGWSPYPACHWVYDSQQNAWNYQDPTEWGSIVHHYGRWAYDQQYGWMWIADGNYGPGHVYWKNENGQVSWAALTPDIDGGGPSEGWQTQDQQSFNSGCRQQAAPPAPVAYRPAAPSYAPPVSYGPRYAAAPPAYSPTAYSPPAYSPPAYSPPYYGPRPSQVFVPFPHHPHWPHFPGSHCQRFPMSPVCRNNPGKTDPSKTNPGKSTSVFCQHNPMVPMCKPGGGNGGIAAGLCATNPDLPNCKKKLTPPTKPPFAKLAGFQRPGFQKFGFQRPGFRPNPFRPGGLRQHFPTTQRHVFAPRPHFQPRGFGRGSRGFGGGFRGGFRGGFGGGFRGGFRFAGRRR